jgi:hypothetical protein
LPTQRWPRRKPSTTSTKPAWPVPTYPFVLKSTRGGHPHLLPRAWRTTRRRGRLPLVVVDPSLLGFVVMRATALVDPINTPLNSIPHLSVSNSTQIKTLARRPPFITVDWSIPSHAVDASVTAVLDLLHLYKESSQHARNRPRHPLLPRRREQPIPAIPTPSNLAVGANVLTVKY